MTPAAFYPDLAGKVALVTGGSTGIGAAACEELEEIGLGPADNDQTIAMLQEAKALSLQKKGPLTEDESGGIAQRVLAGSSNA